MLKKILLGLVCIFSCIGYLHAQAIIDKVPTNMAIRFKNNSSQKVHALFIYTPDFSTVFNVGAWSEQSLKTLTSIANMCATLYDEKQAQKAAQASQNTNQSNTQSQPSGTSTQPSQPQQNPPSTGTQPQKIKLSTAAWVTAAGNITNLLVDIITQPAVIIETMKKKDYFKHVLPGLAVYSHKSPVQRGQMESSIGMYKKTGEITVAIYPDNNYGLPDFKAPLFIADFDLNTYNSVTYGPQAGHAYFQYIDPVTQTVKLSNEKLFVPVRTADDGSLKFQAGGKAALETLHQKEEELNVTLDF